MPGVPLNALAQVKRTLRNLFSRRKKKKQPEPAPSTDAPPTLTTTAAPVSPVEAPATSQRSITEAGDGLKPDEPSHPPAHPAADPTTTTAASLMPDPPPLVLPAPTSTNLPPPEHQPHISAPTHIEDAKAIDLNPARDIKSEDLTDVKTGAPNNVTSRKSETGMSATSGPMGDHMAEVWRDSDVGAKEGRPLDFEGKAEDIPEEKGDGAKF